MYIEDICNSNRCVGCGNCKNSCPLNAIEMRTDKDGFLYPCVDHNRCADCGKCEQRCPHNSLLYREIKDLPDAVIVRANDQDLLLTSASGGLCTLLSRLFINELNGFVCGAVYDESFMVHHIVSNKEEDILKMQQSKYVQSDLNDSFNVVKDRLDHNCYVLMIGTGCQIYALKKFLGKDYEKLFCVDLVCHGTPSPKVQAEYIKWLGKKHGNRVNRINNRNKRLYPHSYVSTYSVEYETRKQEDRRYSDDPMADAFFQHLSIRKSCFDCRFKTIHRISDLTVGDFWFSELYGFGEDKYGVNLCLIQSDKGRTLLSYIQRQITSMTIDSKDAILLNGGMLYSSCTKNKNRELFFDLLGKEPFDSLVFRLDGISDSRRKKNRIREVVAPILRRTRYYNKQLVKSAESRKNRVIPGDKTGVNYYDR